MAKSIVVTTSEGVSYELGYTRATEQVMERQGFRYKEMEDKPATMIPLLVHGAFLLNHRSVSNETVDKVYDQIGDKDGFLAALLELYAEPLNAMLQEDSSKEKKATWKIQ